jgi:predicted TIM-barrel fold metal-dependent hydrolase
MDLSHIPIFDHHAHALFYEDIWRTSPMELYFTEAYDPVILERHVKNNLYFRRSMRELAEFYHCEPTHDAVVHARQQWNYQDLTRKMFLSCNISQWLIDDGIWSDQLMTVEESRDFVGIKTHRVLRLESELAKLIHQFDNPQKLLSAFAEHLHKQAPEIIAFKSIIAYRTGLDIHHHHVSALERSFSELKRGLKSGQIPRINDKTLLDEALWAGLRVASEHSKPVQFHTGYGDPDLDMRLANPLHLRMILEDKSLSNLNIVMLHCYPFVKEAGYLAAVYGGVYLDLGLTIPYTSIDAMKRSAREALHLAPISKVLFSTDAQRSPEIYYLACRWGRRVLGDVLVETVQDGDLSNQEAMWAAERILQKNSAELYI